MKFFAFLIILVLISFSCSVTQVNSGEVGIKKSFGQISETPLHEGWHFTIPVFQSITPFNIKIQSSQIKASAATLDIQDVAMLIVLNYRVPADKAPKLVVDVGYDYFDSLVDPLSHEVIKSVSAQFSAQDMISKREEMRKKAFDDLKHRLEGYNIQLQELSFVDLVFSQVFIKAIEEKQVAEQKALQAMRDLERIKVENQQKISIAEANATSRLALAKAEAEANAMLAKSVDDKVIQLRQLEKWDGKLPTFFGSGSNHNMPIPVVEVGNK